MKDCLNLVKGRELFRPFAPVVTAEEQFAYFELEQESPFMLLATRLRDPYREHLRAIVHADGTSRVQAVSKEQDDFVHSLLLEFKARTGHPVLVNTSFNLAGDPIVESAHDAISAWLSSDIDVLVNDIRDCKPVRVSSTACSKEGQTSLAQLDKARVEPAPGIFVPRCGVGAVERAGEVVESPVV